MQNGLRIKLDSEKVLYLRMATQWWWQRGEEVQSKAAKVYETYSNIDPSHLVTSLISASLFQLIWPISKESSRIEGEASKGQKNKELRVIFFSFFFW